MVMSVVQSFVSSIVVPARPDGTVMQSSTTATADPAVAIMPSSARIIAAQTANSEREFTWIPPWWCLPPPEHAACAISRHPDPNARRGGLGHLADRAIVTLAVAVPPVSAPLDPPSGEVSPDRRAL